MLLKAPQHKFPHLESSNQPQGPVTGSELIVVIIPINPNHHIWYFLVNSMLLKAPQHKFPHLESKSTPGTCNRIRTYCGHHTYWSQSSHLIFSCKFYAFKSSTTQISLFGKFKSTPGTCNRIRNYCGHHTYWSQSSRLIFSCKFKTFKSFETQISFLEVSNQSQGSAIGSKMILIIIPLNSDLEILTFHTCSTTFTHFRIFDSSFGVAKWSFQKKF